MSGSTQYRRRQWRALMGLLSTQRVLAGGEYTLTVATVCEPSRVCARIGNEEIGFSRSGS